MAADYERLYASLLERRRDRREQKLEQVVTP